MSAPHPHHGEFFAPADLPREHRAEENVLACLLSFGPAAAPLDDLARLSAALFADWTHKTIFSMLGDLHARGEPCTAEDVAAALRQAKRTPDAVRAFELATTSGTLPPSSLSGEVDKLAEAAGRRETLAVAERLRSASLNGAAVADILAGARAELTAIEDAGAGPADLFGGGLLSAAALGRLTIPTRRALLGQWFCEGDLGFLFAQRGVGKTWLSLLFARGVAGGAPAGPWKPGEGGSSPVLYVDGEMPLELLQARQRGLGLEGEGVTFLNHEQLFNVTGRLLNLSDPVAQRTLTSLCLERGVKLLVLDNLSCLFRGISENDADAWETVLPWLLELRRRKIAVLIVAHAGRNNAMRGTSRREDAAAWIVRLDDATDGAGPKNGAKFVSSFSKPSRNTPENIPPLEWTVTTDAATGRSTVAYKEAEGQEAVLNWVRNGLVFCREIADEMGVSPGTVSKMAQRLIEAGKLTKGANRNYVIPLLGDEAEGAAGDE